MLTHDTAGWLGEYEIVITHKSGQVERQKVKNRITNAGLNLIRDALMGSVAGMELTHLALGVSNIPLDDNQTQLGNEQFRTNFTSKEIMGPGQIQSTALVLDTEAAINIREIGVFANGGDDPNSGVLISRILWTRDKTNLESIQFTRVDTIGRG